MTKINPLIFREYDIRGVVDEDLSEEFAYLLGRAYATLAKENSKDNIAIGYDCRLSSEGYADALARGMADEGVSACITGLGPTPQLYWAVHKRGFGGGIQITGSHNPSNMNGFKICLGTSTLSGAQIQDLKERVLKLAGTEPTATEKGQISEDLVQEDYTADLTELIRPHMGERKLKVVVDAGNGVGGLVGPALLKNLGVEVTELYCDPDGTFPNHHPDPAELKNIQDLIAKVKETGADFGIGWDGDGDRIGVVDENGGVIFGDMLVLIYARSLLSEVPGAQVVADVKCSSLLFDDIAARGGKPIMWRTGHSLIKSKLKETGAELAGEMSGHIFFSHRYYGFDDGMYCAGRLVELMSNVEGPISDQLKGLPEMFSTPEIRMDCPDEIKFEIADEAAKAFDDFEIITVDGVRINFEKGWGLVRASNTQPVLVLRFEAESEDDLEAYRQIVTTRLDQIKSNLAQ